MQTFSMLKGTSGWEDLTPPERAAMLDRWSRRNQIDPTSYYPYVEDNTFEDIAQAALLGAMEGSSFGFLRPEAAVKGSNYIQELLGGTPTDEKEATRRMYAAMEKNPGTTLLGNLVGALPAFTGLGNIASASALSKLPTLAKVPLEAGFFTGTEAASDLVYGEPRSSSDYMKSMAANMAMVGGGRLLGKLLRRGSEAAQRRFATDIPPEMVEEVGTYPGELPSRARPGELPGRQIAGLLEGRVEDNVINLPPDVIELPGGGGGGGALTRYNWSELAPMLETTQEGLPPSRSSLAAALAAGRRPTTEMALRGTEQFSPVVRGERLPETYPFDYTLTDQTVPTSTRPKKWSIEDTKAVIERVQKGEPTTFKVDPAYAASLGLPSEEVLVTGVTPNGFKVETANGETVHMMFDRANKTIPGVIGVEHRDTQFPAAPETPMAGTELRAKEEIITTPSEYTEQMKSAPASAITQREGLTIIENANDALNLPGGRGLYSREVMADATRRFKDVLSKPIEQSKLPYLEDLVEGRATLPEVIHKLDGGKNLMELVPESHLKKIITDWLENKSVYKEGIPETGTPLDKYERVKYTITDAQRKVIEKAWKEGVTPQTIDKLRKLEVTRRNRAWGKLLKETGEEVKVADEALVIKGDKTTSDTVLDSPRALDEVVQREAQEANFTKPEKRQNLSDVLNC